MIGVSKLAVAKPPRPRQRKALPALTHHDIMSLVAPFAAAGLRVDLAASDRAARVLKFLPIEHAAGEIAAFAVRETLLLDASLTGLYLLTRQMDPLTGTAAADAVVPMPATCEAFGGEPIELLHQINSVSPARHFEMVAGTVVSRNYEIIPAVNDNKKAIGDSVTVLVGARAQCQGVLLKFTCEHDDPLKVELSPSHPGRLRVPQDILAVLGKSWRAVYDYGDHWRSTIRIDRTEPMRTTEAEQRIADALTHLAQTLAAPPEMFHPRHRPDRWRVMFRRLIPLAGCAALIGAALLVGQFPIGDGSVLQMLVFHAPPLLLIGLFLFRELPRFEVPPIPRKLRYAQWLEPVSLGSRSRPA